MTMAKSNEEKRLRNRTIDEIEKEHLYKMALTASNRQNAGITLTPTNIIAVMIFVIQIIIGATMWSIKDKIERYDGYEARISKVEDTLIRYEDINSKLNGLTTQVGTLTSQDVFTETEFNAKLADKLEPMTRQLDRIEETLRQKRDTIDRENEELQKRLRSLETELEIFKRMSQNN